MAACLAAMIAAEGRAQPAPAGVRPADLPPLQPEPGDIWAEVRAWANPRALQPPRPGAAGARQPVPAAREEAPRQPAMADPAGSVPQASRRVVTNASRRSNIRAAPDLGAPVSRSLPPSSALNVFGQGAGGWLHVGEDRPFGWIHPSALKP